VEEDVDEAGGDEMDEHHDHDEAARNLRAGGEELGELGLSGASKASHLSVIKSETIHFRLLRLIDYRRRWMRITWPDGRSLERLRRSTQIGIVVVAAAGARVIAFVGEEAARAWRER
jgi:hypothetical protein